MASTTAMIHKSTISLDAMSMDSIIALINPCPHGSFPNVDGSVKDFCMLRNELAKAEWLDATEKIRATVIDNNNAAYGVVLGHSEYLHTPMAALTSPEAAVFTLILLVVGVMALAWGHSSRLQHSLPSLYSVPTLFPVSNIFESVTQLLRGKSRESILQAEHDDKTVSDDNRTEEHELEKEHNSNDAEANEEQPPPQPPSPPQEPQFDLERLDDHLLNM